MGQRFPLIADLTDTELPPKIESSVDWIVDSLLDRWPTRCSRSSRTEASTRSPRSSREPAIVSFPGPNPGAEGPSGPAGPGLHSQFARGRVMFGGCYFAGTGEDPETEQAFASGVLMRLIQDQDSVSWTEEAMRENARLQRTAEHVRMALGLVIAVLLMAILGLVGVRLLRGNPPSSQDTSVRAG